MTQTSRILCAVDSSEPSQAAFQRALALSQTLRAELMLVHVVSSEMPTAATIGTASRTALIATLRQAAADAGVRVSVSIRGGHPADAIVQRARESAPDLLVIGTHQRTRLRRLRAGSVAEAVIRRAVCPVLIVPLPPVGAAAGAAAAAIDGSKAWSNDFSHALPNDMLNGATAGFGHVVCAIDFAAASSAAFTQALALAATEASRVTLVHVVGVPEYHSLDTLDAWRALNAAIPHQHRNSGRFQVRVVTGDAATEIVRIGAHVEADLIVVGVTARGAIGRRLFGSTAARVMRSAGRPVLAVPAAVGRQGQADVEARAFAAVA